MSSQTCEIIQLSDGRKCGKKAEYFSGKEYLCALHAHHKFKRRKNDYLIKNQERVLSMSASSQPTIELKHELSGILLNVAICRFEYKGISFRTAEAAYQAMKFFYTHEDPATNQALYERVYKISEAMNQTDVRKLGHDRSLPIRSDWRFKPLSTDVSDTGIYSIRDRFMFDILEKKFAQSPQAASELLATEDKELLFVSSIGEYWSNGSNAQGENRLGELLMMVRWELASNQ